MRLIHIPGACSLAVHIALNKVGVKFDLGAYDPSTGQVDGDERLSSITAKPYVPTLILRDGEILNETAAILMSLDEMYPKAELLPKDAIARRKAREWLVYISSELHKTFAPLFSPATSADQIEAIRARIAARFDYIENALADDGAFLLGDEVFAPDMYLFVMTLWAGVQNISLDHWPALSAYQRNVAASEPVAQALTREGLPQPGARDAA